MPRKIRIEYPGACYHVINRGNYRSWIFSTPGARKSFLEALKKVCAAKKWTLHAWCLMGNHYHLCVETKEANLVEGMRWLQSVFANNFNRFRKESGHVFQGRYKAILLEKGALGPVSHYIHLNPVRAGIVECRDLQKYRESSFHKLWYPGKRWACEDFTVFLQAAGNLVDKPAGRRSYRDYLEWLSEQDEEKKKMGFENMLKGWVKGSDDFKQSILDGLEEKKVKKVVESEAAELKISVYERVTRSLLNKLGKAETDILKDRKGASWKIATARYLRDKHLAPNQWIADRLQIGKATSVQSLVSRHRKLAEGADPCWDEIKNHDFV